MRRGGEGLSGGFKRSANNRCGAWLPHARLYTERCWMRRLCAVIVSQIQMPVSWLNAAKEWSDKESGGS